MPRLEPLGKHATHARAAPLREAMANADLVPPDGRRLDQARTADLAWRSDRSRPVQDRLERAFGAQAFGQWLALGGFWVIALASWAIAFVCCLISLCGFELEPLLARAFLSPVALPGLTLVVMVLAGMGLAQLGRCHRKHLLRWARRHSIDVDDPGEPSLPTFQT